jgi:hypothetical protein
MNDINRVIDVEDDAAGLWRRNIKLRSSKRPRKPQPINASSIATLRAQRSKR